MPGNRVRKNPYYELTDLEEISRLIRENPWATLVSNPSTGLVASHYPILLEEDREDISVVTHVGRPDETVHELGEHELLVIVQGPHGYISSAGMATTSRFRPGTSSPPTSPACRRSSSQMRISKF